MIRLAVCALAVLVLTALPAQAARQGTVLKLATASGASLKFSTSALKARPGTVTIVLSNRGMMPHNVAVKGAGVNVKGKVVGTGGTSTVTARLKRGRYEFYCSVPGHEQAGMKGVLTVG